MGECYKDVSGTRELKAFTLPMILCNQALEIEHPLPKELLQSTMDTCLYEVLDVLYRPELGLIVENVKTDGILSDTFAGRQIIPGHGIEAKWFCMDLGVRLGRPDIIEKAVDIILQILDFSWDKKYDGIFYFLDSKGAPRHELEWVQKLWWVHIVTFIPLIKGYHLSGDKECWDWFQKVHDYVLTHFTVPKLQNGSATLTVREKFR